MIILPFSKKSKTLTKKNSEKKEDKEYVKDLDLEPRLERLQRYKSQQDISTSFLYNNYNQLALARWNLFLKKMSLKQYLKAISHFLFFLFNSIGVILKFLLWIFFLTYTGIGIIIIFSPLKKELNYYYPFFENNLLIITFILLWCSIVYAMISRTKKGNSINSVRFMQFMPLIFLVFLTITIYQKRKAENTIRHKTYDVSFLYNGHEVQSNKSRVFVGKTADYIFLRDLKESKNFIYPISEIKNLEIQKISP